MGTSPVVGEDFIEQQKLASHLIVRLFLVNLREGDIELLGRSLARDDIIPKQVSFAYEIQTDTVTVHIYNELVKPLTVPLQQNFVVKGVTVIVSDDGVIQEVKAHMVAEP
ncbi:MAG: hypothetical protein OEZ68_14860 [Gammaproteobacteria bacterium]|nr:hypothetical protein [Gammaproteobacteria bacterium]MDH5802083.1 hypothetical protein [Gammaproteobacteria bacterium]